MKALILCAGLGTRLKPLTDTNPKCMMDVAGKPCLERIVEHLNKFGITEIVVNLHWLYPAVMEYFGDRLLYFYEPNLLGEEETEKRLASWLGTRYLVCNGDTLTDIEIDELDVISVESRTTVKNLDGKVYTGIKIVDRDNERENECDIDCYWQDIGTPEGLAKAREHYDKSKFGVLS